MAKKNPTLTAIAAASLLLAGCAIGKQAFSQTESNADFKNDWKKLSFDCKPKRVPELEKIMQAHFMVPDVDGKPTYCIAKIPTGDLLQMDADAVWVVWGGVIPPNNTGDGASDMVFLREQKKKLIDATLNDSTEVQGRGTDYVHYAIDRGVIGVHMPSRDSRNTVWSYDPAKRVFD